MLFISVNCRLHVRMEAHLTCKYFFTNSYLVICKYELVFCKYELVNHKYELVFRIYELLSRKYEFVKIFACHKWASVRTPGCYA